MRRKLSRPAKVFDNATGIRGSDLQVGDVVLFTLTQRKPQTVLYVLPTADSTTVDCIVSYSTQWVNVVKQSYKRDTRYSIKRPAAPKPLSDHVQQMLNELLRQNGIQPVQV